MPSTVIVNFLTTQHKISMGTTLAFPDVCKTPAPPAPAPVPVPYPNVGQSMMAALKVTKRVSDDTGQKIMLMQSAYTMTSGDEPGVALGIVSNRVKGKSITQNSSFNVKFEGKGVSRLSDPHGDNAGSGPPNAFTPAEMQGPHVAIDTTALGKDQREACEKLKEKEVPKPPETEADVARKAGMQNDDFQSYKKVCEEEQVAVSFRDTNPACMDHLANNDIASKGHDVLSKTFEKDALPDGDKDLAGLVSILDKKPEKLFDDKGKLTKEAIEALPKGVDPDSITSAKDLLYRDSEGRLLTGDYDMADIFDNDGNKIGGGGLKDPTRENDLIDKMNRAAGSDQGKQPRIKHGAQANFDDFVHSDEGRKEMRHLKKEGKDFPSSLNQPGVKVGKQGELIEGMTMIDGSHKPGPPTKIYRLDTPEDVINMYRCKGQELPERWRFRDEKGKFVKIETGSRK